MPREPKLPQGSITIENCDREPIHVPGSIQPHGVLLVVQGPDLVIRHASANAGRIAGETVPVIGKPLASVLPEAEFDDIRRACPSALSVPNRITSKRPREPKPANALAF